jgi:hypothetical protein
MEWQPARIRPRKEWHTGIFSEKTNKSADDNVYKIIRVCPDGKRTSKCGCRMLHVHPEDASPINADARDWFVRECQVSVD